MLYEAAVHTSFPNTGAKAAREKEVVTTFHPIPAKQALCVSLKTQATSLSPSGGPRLVKKEGPNRKKKYIYIYI
jgi:hypothetical protein